MNIMGKIRQKYTGFILQAAMLKISCVSMDFRIKNGFSKSAHLWIMNGFLSVLSSNSNAVMDDYEEMLVLLLRHLLITFHRELTREHILKNEYLDQEMNTAVTYFSENYNQDINIEDYAASRGMSVSWFIRNFKKYTGSTPMQFIVGIRINNAQMLLETTTYSINEISKIVGYDNQLYFSRFFTS